MDEQLYGLLGINPEDLRRQSMTQGLLSAGLNMLAASGPSSMPVGLGQVVAQGGNAFMQAQQNAQQQAIQNALQRMQMQQMLESRKRQAEIQKLTPALYRERMGQVPTTIPTETYEDVQTTTEGVVGREIDPNRLRQLAMLGPEGRAAALDALKFEQAMTPEMKTVTAKPGEQIVDPRTGRVIYQAPFEPKESKVETEKLDLGNKIVIVDKAQPGKILASYPKARDTAPKNVTDIELKVGKDFENAVQPYVGINWGYQKVQAAVNNPSPAGDLSLIFGFMKILDPASVVRETEFANAQNAAGVPDQIRNQYNKILSGERLNPNQRADFIQQARELARSQKDVYQNTVLPRYESIVATNQLNRANVLFDPFAGIDFTKSPEPPKAPSAANKPVLQQSDIDLVNKFLNRGK